LVPDSELPKAAHSECDRLGVGDAGHPPAFAGKNDILSSQYKENLALPSLLGVGRSLVVIRLAWKNFILS